MAHNVLFTFLMNITDLCDFKWWEDGANPGRATSIPSIDLQSAFILTAPLSSRPLSLRVSVRVIEINVYIYTSKQACIALRTAFSRMLF